MEQQVVTGLTDQQRTDTLQAEVTRYIRKGYRVVNQAAFTAQLVKPKRFSFLFAVLWLCVAVVGLAVYLMYYAAKRDKQVYLSVDASGRISREG